MYITGTITDANPGPALHTAMSTALTTAGYTLVDTVVISTRTHKIWKSAAANNAHNLDWYLDIAYTTTGAGTLGIYPFEYYDPATDLGYRGAVSSSSTTIDAATGSNLGATGQALETIWVSGPTYTGLTLSITATSFGYWISITPERVIILNSNYSTILAYAGFYVPDPMYASKAGAALYPLVVARLNASGGATFASSSTTAASVSAAITRIPPVTSFVSVNWGATVVSLNLIFQVYGGNVPPLPTGSTTAYPFVAYPVDVSTNGSPTVVPLARWGVFRDVLQVSATTAVARGDTVTIGGSQYVLTTYGSSPNTCLLFKAA